MSDERTNSSEVFIFARFHASPGNEALVEAAVLGVLAPSRVEPGCLSMHAFRSRRDPALFYIHSRWRDEVAFDLHAALPHTIAFLARVQCLIDHPLDVTRTERIG